MINLNPCNLQSNHLVPVFDRLLGQFFNERPAANGGTSAPVARIRQRDDASTIEVDLPGFRKEEVKLNVEGNRLTLEAAVPADDERAFRGSFRGHWRLAEELDPARVEARFENGVLEVRVPKRESAAVRVVEVR